MSDTEFEKLVKQIKTQLKIIGWTAYGLAFVCIVLMFLIGSGWFAIPILFFCWVGHSAFHNLGDMK